MRVQHSEGCCFMTKIYRKITPFRVHLVAFLQTLTDTTITTDERWSNPFCLNTCVPAIVGQSEVCVNEPITYSITPNEAGTTYLWNIVGSYVLVSDCGANDTNCTVRWTGGTTGTIQVTQIIP